MIWWKIAASAIAGYLLGSLSAAILLTRRKFGADVRGQGSGNAGATNVARVYGLRAGLLTLLGDAVKTAVSMLLGWLLAGQAGMCAAAFGCLLGHCFPLYFGFKGGKAVSVGGAIGLCLDWRVFLLIIAVFLLVAFLTKRVSAGSMSAAVAFPLAQLVLGGFAWYALALGCFIAALVVFMHRENLKRLLRGTEPAFKIGK